MAIAFDASLGSHNSGTTASPTLTTSAAAAAGSKIILAMGWYSGTLSSVSGGGLTWTILKSVANGNNTSAVIVADAPSGLASGTTITASLTGTPQATQMAAASFTGLATGTGTDGTASATDATAAWSSGSLASPTTNANDLLIGVSKQGTGSDNTDTPGTGYTELYDFGDGTGDTTTLEYQIVSATGTYAATGTWSGSGSDANILVTLKAAAGGGTTFNDSGTGAIHLAGSGTESHIESASGTGAIVLGGSGVESHVGTDSGTGAIHIGGSGIESHSATESGTGAIIIGGSGTEHFSHSGSGTGAIIINGSGTESFNGSTVYNDSGTGTIHFGGSGTEIFSGAADHLDPVIRFQLEKHMTQSGFVVNLAQATITGSLDMEAMQETVNVADTREHDLFIASGVAKIQPR